MAPRSLLVGFALFLAVIAYLLASSLVRRSLPTFEATSAERPPEAAFAWDVDTFTVDTSDPNRWQYFSFERRSLVDPVWAAGARANGSSPWDVAFRRFHVVPAVAAADLGPVGLDSEIQVSAEAWVPSTFARDTANVATARWYRYSFVTHLLESRGHVYAIRGWDGREVRLEVLSYYCPGMRAGCLTIRYR